jgi:CBS domain-containing protein
MTPDVIFLREETSLTDAVETLRNHRITGAPVVDHDGKLTGILSLSDVIDAAAAQPFPAVDPRGSGNAAWRLLERHGVSAVSADDVSLLVRDRMTRVVASVRERASLVDCARVMCQGHWHRLPVLDPEGKLVGIVSTMDLLAAMVHTADEMA